MATSAPLSPAQTRFADAHGSIDSVWPGRARGRPASGSVFMYRERHGCTDRWLVASDGAELDWTLMHRGDAPGRSETSPARQAH